MKSILSLSAILCLVASFIAQAQSSAARPHLKFELVGTRTQLNKISGGQTQIEYVETFEVQRSGIQFQSGESALDFYLRLKVAGPRNDIWIESRDASSLIKLKLAIESGSIVTISAPRDKMHSLWTSGYKGDLSYLNFTLSSKTASHLESLNDNDENYNSPLEQAAERSRQSIRLIDGSNIEAQ